ncbi:MAG: TIGR01212 family radical SAM protein [Oscillospiraceae bacterium]|nr:TIGR01212 family radical SAM protein [Oscillospiraceae bacterium]
MVTLNEHYRQRFGCKVYKLSLDAGLTCPNRDGTVGVGGCIFCSGSGSGEFAEGGASIEAQLRRAKERVGGKIREGKYIAYFQSFTNTYAPVETLRRLYMAAIAPEDILGLSVGTRPDCLGEDVVKLLQEVNAIKPVSVELGLQTIHEDTAAYIRRGYPTAVFYDAVARLKAAGIEVVTHIILGLPGETMEMAVQTTRAAVAAGTDGVKFHLLHVLRGTDLAREYEQGKFSVLTLEEYGAWLKACIDVLPENTVVHRITGDGAKKDLIAPLWSGDKKRVLNYLHKLLGMK